MNYFNERAVPIHEKAMDIDPQDTLCWLGRGANALYRMARYEEAIRAYDRVIKIVPPYLNTACGGA